VFVSAVPNWSVGDLAMIRPGVKFRILHIDVDRRDEQTVWTAEPVQNRH
jgi:hypothetical protein